MSCASISPGQCLGGRGCLSQVDKKLYPYATQNRHTAHTVFAALRNSTQRQPSQNPSLSSRMEVAQRLLWVAMSLSRLWQQQGEQAEAQQLLAEIYHWFPEGVDTKDLQEAKRL
jgi:predicted ATPase